MAVSRGGLGLEIFMQVGWIHIPKYPYIQINLKIKLKKFYLTIFHENRKIHLTAKRQKTTNCEL
jgi:hypothetical protein